MTAAKFPECDSCVNRKFDPFQCDECVGGNKYEGEDDIEELTVAQFIDLFGGNNDF